MRRQVTILSSFRRNKKKKKQKIIKKIKDESFIFLVSDSLQFLCLCVSGPHRNRRCINGLPPANYRASCFFLRCRQMATATWPLAPPLFRQRLNDQTSAKVLVLPCGGHSTSSSYRPGIIFWPPIGQSFAQTRADKMRSNDSPPTVVHLDIWLRYDRTNRSVSTSICDQTLTLINSDSKDF